MAQRHQFLSTALLMMGVGLVFAGMTSAMHFTPAGIVATVATIAGLLYAGGVWFGGAATGDPSIVIFDRRLMSVSGSHPGRPVSDMFPLHVRREVEQRCRDAFDGRSTRFSMTDGGPFEVAPIRTANGLIAYGILLSGALVRSVAEELTPVA